MPVERLRIRGLKRDRAVTAAFEAGADSSIWRRFAARHARRWLVADKDYEIISGRARPYIIPTKDRHSHPSR